MIGHQPAGRTAAPIRLADSRVVRMEHHDEAYHVWREARLGNRTLLHVDAHHDLWWFDTAGALNIANFVCQALKDGLVGRIYWVVPDPTWQRPEGRQAVLRHLQQLNSKYPGGSKAVETGDQSYAAELLGKPLVACPLSSLPIIGEPVLLDIDVDFLMIPVVAHGEPDTQSAVPWLWPPELLDSLCRRGLRSDLVTIAYSVDGGYTPLCWKYLGDELAARLGEFEAPIEAFDDLRAGALAHERGDLETATQMFKRAVGVMPDSASAHDQLARAYLAAGRQELARESYRRARALDPAYGTPYSSNGLALYTARSYQRAEQVWHETLALNPEDAHARLGLARLAARQGRWADAIERANDALAHDEELTDAYRIIGRAHEARGETLEAIRAYEHSLKLARAGHRSVAVSPTSAPADQVIDPDHFPLFARLGRLYAAAGDDRSAIENYRMAIAGRYDGFRVRRELAMVHVRRGQYGPALREAWNALQWLPAALADRWRHTE